MPNERVRDTPLPRFVCFDVSDTSWYIFSYRFEQLEYIGRGVNDRYFFLIWQTIVRAILLFGCVVSGRCCLLFERWQLVQCRCIILHSFELHNKGKSKSIIIKGYLPVNTVKLFSYEILNTNDLSNSTFFAQQKLYEKRCFSFHKMKPETLLTRKRVEHLKKIIK